ncbi:hypothetical protein KRMM14A1004_02470 [Krasilnikovia sp. MM14-A1004]
MPVPAMTQAMSAPMTPVSCANRRGSEKTPAPTIEPTTIAVIVQKVSFAAVGCVVFVSVAAITRPSRSPDKDILGGKTDL